MASDQVNQSIKDHLRETFDRLNPTEIKRKVERLHKELRKTGAERALRAEEVAEKSAAAFIWRKIPD